MAAKKDNKDNTQHVGLRMPLKLVEQIDEIYYFNRTDRSTEIIKACEEYVERFSRKKAIGVAEPKHIYTVEQYKQAETDDELRAEILMNSESPAIRLMFAEIQKQKLKKEQSK